MTPTDTDPVPFPASDHNKLGDSTDYEPSGLVLFDGDLYMASDDGIIVIYENNAWKSIYTATQRTFSSQEEINSKSYTKPDFESITVAKNKLMLGLEGDASHLPQIARFDTESKTITSSWLLTLPSGVSLSRGGMEAMTFVPKEYCPAFNPNGPYYGGYFFVAFQSVPKKIYVYDLPKGNGTMRGNGGAPICEYDIDINMEASDMCFANGVLYVLFDEEGKSDLLAVYTTHTQQNSLSFQKQYSLPCIADSDSDYEGITFDRQTIYLARDSNATSAENAVYKYPHTIIYPQNVIPPLN